MDGSEQVSAARSDDWGSDAVDTEHVLFKEYELIWPDEAPLADLADYHRRLKGKEQAALCLSGGGIRSAAFALGVLQALSRKRLLTGFHYLSTVSGGGYIGSWLQRWIKADGDAGRVMEALGADEEPHQIKALRENSNFITPRVGLGSNDTWTAIAMSIRNIAINWLLFLPLLLLVAVVPNLFQSGVYSIAPNAGQHVWLLWAAVGLATFLVAIASWNTCAGLPSYRDKAPGPGAGDGWLFKWIVLPLIGWSIFATLALATDLNGTADWIERLRARPDDGSVDPVKAWIPEGGLVALTTLAGMLIGLVASGVARGRGYLRTFFSDTFATALALLTPPALILVGAWLFHRVAPSLAPPLGLSGPEAAAAVSNAAEWRAILLTVFGPLWLIGSQIALTIVFVAFRNPKGRNVKPDADREWMARLSAAKSKPALFWAVVGISALLLFRIFQQWASGYDMSVTTALAALAGLTAVAGAKNEATGDAVGKARGAIGKAAGFLKKHLPLQRIVTLAAFLFIVLLLLILAQVEWILIEPLAKRLDRLPEAVDEDVTAHFIVAVLLGLLSWWLSYRIDANRFSLHGFYRNRLARASLGGARKMRDPDPFTGFDPKDNVRLHTLAPKAGERRVLYPVINAALNVTATDNLAWQERKAEPFVFTPLFSGSGMLPNETREAERAAAATRARAEAEARTTAEREHGERAESPVEASDDLPGVRDPRPQRDGAYISSQIYGGSEADLAMAAHGVSLATAMTISGAAASPNMGYNSSPAAAFLMTLFNVRLGAWLPNPARARLLGDRIGSSSPDNSLRALLRELAGSTDDRGKEIYLSDGGHFENLAIYEMVRRRCRFIVVTDAGQDPNCAFEDLGNAVRKVKIDFNVTIRFKPMRISSRDREVKGQTAWAIGTVHYPGQKEEGTILYLKPSFFGRDLPVDIVSYAMANSSFPHESTLGDQFFSESQFESYRKLGFHFMEELTGKAKEATLPALFEAMNAMETSAPD